MGEEEIWMNHKEASRMAVIQRVLDGVLTQAGAGVELGLTTRQIKRLCKRLREQGPAGMVSLRRGRPSPTRIATPVRQHFVELVRSQYADFGPQLAWEYLSERHGFTHSVQTLRSWMVADGLWQAKQRRALRQHPSRPRRPRRGELVQIDGSHHDWLEGRGPKCCLIAFIDDANSEVLGAWFFDSETSQNYLDMLKRYVSTHGIPLSLYSDRHSIFTKSAPEDNNPTQFERALEQLGIEGICARSPQAKGRVERLFQTLQDRLCKAMRQEGICEMAAANAFLQAYIGQHNARFATSPADQADAHRCWAGSPEELARICALHHQREMSTGQSCQFQGQIIQLLPAQAHAPKGKAKLDIAEHSDGCLEVLYNGKPLRFKRFAMNPRSRSDKLADAKQLNAKVDKVVLKERRRIERLQVQMQHQQSQRESGIYKPASYAHSPPRW